MEIYILGDRVKIENVYNCCGVDTQTENCLLCTNILL